LTGHFNTVSKLATLSNGNLASGSWDTTVRIWNPNTGSLIYILWPSSSVTSLVKLPNGNLASGSIDGTVKIWNPNTGSLIYTLTGHTRQIWQLASLPNGNLASIDNLYSLTNYSIKIWTA